MSWYNDLEHLIKEFFQGMAGAFRQTSTDRLEFELHELENMFGLLVLGSFIGIPSPPSGVGAAGTPVYAARNSGDE